MVVLVETNDRDRLPGLVKPAHGLSTIQIPTQGLVRHVRTRVLGKDRMRVCGIDIRKPGGESADRLDRLVAENGLHSAGRWIEEPQPGPGRPFPFVVEVDGFSCVR